MNVLDERPAGASRVDPEDLPFEGDKMNVGKAMSRGERAQTG